MYFKLSKIEFCLNMLEYFLKGRHLIPGDLSTDACFTMESWLAGRVPEVFSL
jgi:hypothetical protein